MCRKSHVRKEGSRRSSAIWRAVRDPSLRQMEFTRIVANSIRQADLDALAVSINASPRMRLSIAREVVGTAISRVRIRPGTTSCGLEGANEVSERSVPATFCDDAASRSATMLVVIVAEKIERVGPAG